MQFKDVIGFGKVKLQLLEQFHQQRISHAQLFLGESGSGHFQLSLAYAQLVNCLNPLEDDSCGVCSSCKKFTNFQHPDLFYVFPNNTNDEVKKDPRSLSFLKTWITFLKEHPYFTIDDWSDELGTGNKQLLINKLDVSDLIHNLSLQKNDAKYRIVFLWYPEKMNGTSANKILKALEEPIDDTLFIFVGHQSEELLPTILSRLQVINTGGLTLEEIEQGLITLESLPEESAKSIAVLCEGDFSKALKMSINPDSGLLFTEMFITWMRGCYELKMVVLMQWIDEINSLGREKQKDFLNYCLRMFREVIVYNYAGPELSSMNSMEQNFVKKFCKFVHAGNIDFFNDSFNEISTAIQRNGNAKIQFLSLSLKVCNFLRYKP